MSLAVMDLEIKKWLPRPLLWVLWGLCFMIISLFFYRLCVDYLTLSHKAMSHEKMPPSVLLEIVKPLFSWSIVLFTLFIPVFTIGAFSQEYRHRTFTLWAMSTYRARSIVLGKFLAIFLFPLTLTIAQSVMVFTLAIDTHLDLAWVFCSFLTVLLISASIISFGLYISSLHSSTLAATTLTIGGTLIWMLIEWLNPFPHSWGDFAQHLSLLNHSYHLLNGLFVSKDIVFYCLFILLWLTLTQLNIEKKLKQYDHQI